MKDDQSTPGRLLAEVRSLGAVVAGCLLLSACQTSEVPRSPPLPEQSPEPRPSGAVVTVPSRAEWLLLKRESLCERSPEERRALHDKLVGARDDSSAERRVLLASCRPEQTPGLLRKALQALPESEDRTVAERALFRLMEDHARSYRILEEKNRKLEAQLKTTIEGIREIETDMDRLQEP